MPTISVIIPVFRAEKSLRKCVESIVYGEEKDLEVILVEDCSPDGSWVLCQQLEQEYPQVKSVRNERNRGVSYTRNRGLEEASGKYVLFVDGDDWVSGRYVSQLIQTHKENPEKLVLCSYHYIDHTTNSLRVYGAAEGKGQLLTLAREAFFQLSEKVLLQQVWNKVFERETIQKARLRFDESISMGEDFQFVLDYIMAKGFQECVIINEPLYYYIRWNDSSLMSKFGFADIQTAINRIVQLARIAGPAADVHKDEMIAQTKQNYVYQIARSKRYSKQERLDAIERVLGDGNAISHYRKQRHRYAKEQTAQRIVQVKQLVPRIRGRLHRRQLQRKTVKAVTGVHADGISIISQNCIGGALYHDLGLPFLSPTINAFFFEPDFVRFVSNLRHYMGQELVMRWGEDYPIGILDDITIHFMHYETCTEAKEAWERRKTRINWGKILVIATDRNGFNDSVFDDWKKITYPKILFTVQKKYASDSDSVYFPEYEANGFVPDLIPNREFYKDGILVDKIKRMGGNP